METQNKALKRTCYLEFVIGVIFIVVGAWVFINPVPSFAALSIVCVITFLKIGVTKTIFAFSTKKFNGGWVCYLAGGVVDVFIGVLLVSMPSFAFSLLQFYIGYAMLFRFSLAIGLSFKLRWEKISDWGPLLFFGISCFVLSFIMLWNPVIAELTILAYTAIVFLINGIFHLILTVGLKKLYKEFKMESIMS